MAKTDMITKIQANAGLKSKTAATDALNAVLAFLLFRRLTGGFWRSAFAAAPRLHAKTKWRRLPGMVRHVFTHFPLELTVFVASTVLGGHAAPTLAGGPGVRSLQEAFPLKLEKAERLGDGLLLAYTVVK